MPDRSPSPADRSSDRLDRTGCGRAEERRIFLYNLKGHLLYASHRDLAAYGPGASSQRQPKDRFLKPHIQQLCSRLKTVALSRSDRGRARRRFGPEAVSVQVGPSAYRLHGLLLDPETATEPLVLIVVDVAATGKQAQHDLAYLKHLYNLTRREVEVLEWVRKGTSYKEMAQGLGISPHTIRDHILKLKLKFQADSKCGIMARLLAENCLL